MVSKKLKGAVENIMPSSKRDEIINSVINMTIEKGYFGTSVTKIVEEAGISKGSFYTYFKSKDSVYIEILKKRVEEIAFEHRIIEKASSSFDTALKYFITTKMNLKCETLKVELVVLNLTKNIEDLEENLKEVLEKVQMENVGFIEKLLNKFFKELDIEKGEIKRYSELINVIIRDFRVSYFSGIKEKLKRNLDVEELYDEKAERDSEFLYKSILKFLK